MKLMFHIIPCFLAMMVVPVLARTAPGLTANSVDIEFKESLYEGDLTLNSVSNGIAKAISISSLEIREDVECPPEGFDEAEVCGEDTNGGCNSTPPVFTTIECGETFCGEAWAEGSTRDTDWYEVVLTEPTLVEWRGVADFDFALGLVETVPYGSGDCSDATGYIEPYELFPANEEGGIEVALYPGTYWFFIAPDDYDSYPCSGGPWNYVVMLECATMECPPEALDEGEGCGEDINGGCNSTPPVFTAIECGETFCGEAWAEGDMRDTDWYEFVVTEVTAIEWRAEANFGVALGLVETVPSGSGDCADITGYIEPYESFPPFSDAGIALVLDPGTYWLFVSTDDYVSYPCSLGPWTYAVSLDCFDCWDNDADGYYDEECQGTDCDDTNPNVNPGHDEVKGNGIDDDCDGEVDESSTCFIGLAL